MERALRFTFLPNKLGKSRTLFSPMGEREQIVESRRMRFKQLREISRLLDARATSRGNKAALLFVFSSKSRMRIFLYLIEAFHKLNPV